MGWQVIGQENAKNAKKDAGFSQTALIQEDDDFCVNFISERLLKRTRGREPRGGAEIAEEDETRFFTIFTITPSAPFAG
jgi:hypothetical protein